MDALKRVHSFKCTGLIRRVLLSWLLAVTMEFLLLPEKLRNLEGLEGMAQMSLLRVAAITLCGTVFLAGVSRFVNSARAERWGFASLFTLLAAAALRASFTWAYLVICILILTLLIVFGVYGWNGSPKAGAAGGKEHRAYFWITGGLTLTFFLFVTTWTVGRVYSFSTPTFDFGIFSQMFYYMKKTGLPMTTVERDGILSHFAVHVSPIYYLMLPFYWLVPAPATLQVLQAAVMASSVIPLWKIGRHHGLSAVERMLLCALLLVYPAFSGGAGYDIHENCFLTPLLLWLFYGIARRNTVLTAVSALLTLMVKEDAAVYVAVAALWLMVKTLLRFRKTDVRELITGIVLLSVSFAWFFLVTGYLASSGDGVMTYRYDNLIYDRSGSLLTVVKSVLLNPLKAIYECVDAEKLGFIAMTMLPLVGLPLLTRRYERYILVIPYLLVNLMSDYPYQHDIFFQYTFGSTACLFYLTAVNLADWKPDCRRILALVFAVAVSVACFGAAVVPKAMRYPAQCVCNSERYQQIRNALDGIPEEASVTAATFYAAYLSQREMLYDVKYSSKEHMLQTQYVVLDLTAEGDLEKYAGAGRGNGFENLVMLLETNGYACFDTVEDLLVIYRKEPAAS